MRAVVLTVIVMSVWMLVLSGWCSYYGSVDGLPSPKLPLGLELAGQMEFAQCVPVLDSQSSPPEHRSAGAASWLVRPPFDLCPAFG